MAHTFEFKGKIYRSHGKGQHVIQIGIAKPNYTPPTPPTDPVELIIWRALTAAQVPFTSDPNQTLGLDFKLLTEPPFYIECKQFHSPRITEQMSRAKDVIAVQGIEAAHFLAGLFK